MSTLSKFPIYSLPIIVIRKVLKYMSLFELVSLSLCSCSSKKICKSVWTSIQCQTARHYYDFICLKRPFISIRLDFYPFQEWKFNFDKLPKSKKKKNETSGYFSTISRNYISKKDKCESPTQKEGNCSDQLYFSSWTPDEQSFNKKYVTIGDFPPLRVFTMKMWSRSGKLFHDIKMWILYLSDLFNIQLYTISLGLDQLNSGDIQEIADLYTPRNEKETGIERMMLFKYNKKFQAEKKLIHSALRRINVTHELEIYLNPSSKFRFDFKNRQSKPMVLHLEYSKVIDINQVIEMDFQSIRLLRSKLKNYNFKLLIEKWRDGWTPKWTRLMIEFNEMLDIDSYIVGAVTEITDYRDRSVIDRNTPIHSYKFQDKQEYSFGTLIKNGYHIVRFDESVATVTVENNRIGWFDIQSNSSLSRFKALGLHPRTFYVSNDI